MALVGHEIVAFHQVVESRVWVRQSTEPLLSKVSLHIHCALETLIGYQEHGLLG
jgi:hypothetical protein